MTEEEKASVDIRDKQLMKPKVLIIAPFRSNAKKIVDEMIRLLTPPSGKLEVAYRKRFLKEFGHDLQAEKEFQQKKRPDEFKRIFGGNSDDHFRMGLSYTPKQLKLYTPFYASDVIIASPLGLKRVIGDDSEDKRKEYDFLSSIEIVVVEHADYILMQNISHLLHIFKNLNLMPKKAHDCDFGRVKLWSAEGHSKYYRQTIFLSHTPNLNFDAIMTKLCFNYRGYAECRLQEVSSLLALKNVALPIPQIFRKVEGGSMGEVLQNRYKIFMKIMNEISKAKIKNVLVYIPNTLHFYVLRDKLTESKIEHVCLTEETSTGRSKTAKKMFESGERPVLVFTERRHFFHRVTQRKVSRVIFFEPPTFPHYYSEVSNFIIDPSFSDVTVLCSKFDRLQLEGILGRNEAKSLLRNEKEIVCFMNEK
ncbi:Oidioi.mRNA.OKI2018_I69.XSR.g15547.t1.cds [Oikopleura dioica]|uniref:U3 small nucleolar RNA-associated protein 25 homolog n=1 Tax=Oikopleura dioica TaxID=34765 RepID=A0ABN7SIC1_OIKDI|nr:Oidioi.mRNA.OKI2018_I69.XSR.g15547.t1.cds [Oikopleura dioica]